MQITIGRTVLYELTAQDAEAINRRRTSGGAITERIQHGSWPLGAQAHIGNPVSEGDTFPMIVVKVWPQDMQDPAVNGQTLLDGNDVLWVTGIVEGSIPGTWRWPERV